MKHTPKIQNNHRKAMKPAIEYQRDVQKEVNEHKIEIDKSIFSNSKDERELIKEFRKHISKMSPQDLQKSREETITAILGSKTPNWGNVNIIL